MVSMEYLVDREKICLVGKLMHRTESDNYARQVLEEQVAMGWEGIAKEAREICNKLGLPDITKKDIHRVEVSEAMKYHHLKVVKEEMKPYTKLEKLVNKDCTKMEDYMREKSLKDARLEFKWQTGVIESRVTMKAIYKNSRFPVCCPHCPEGRSVGVPESPAHWLECSGYRDLRQGIDPELVLKDRCSYLRKVIERRKRLEEQLRKEISD